MIEIKPDPETVWTEKKIFGRRIPFSPEAGNKVRELLAYGTEIIVLQILDIPRDDFNPFPILGYLTRDGRHFAEEVQEHDSGNLRINLTQVASFSL
jgi:hypothetical protein